MLNLECEGRSGDVQRSEYSQGVTKSQPGRPISEVWRARRADIRPDELGCVLAASHRQPTLITIALVVCSRFSCCASRMPQ